MPQPLVSIIIPTFNRETTIIRAVDSVINQTYKNIEIIIIDDASKDNTVDLLRSKYSDQIILIALQKNEGGANCRNIGVKHSNGELICFLDSDDMWLPTKLQKQIDLWYNLSNREKFNFFCYTSVTIIKSHTKNKVSPVTEKNTTSLSKYLFCDNNIIQTSTFMFSRELLNKHSFRNLKKHQDWDLLFSLEKSGINMHFINEPLVQWIQDQQIRVSSNFDHYFSINWYWNVVNSYEYEVCFYKIVIFPFMIKSNFIKSLYTIHHFSKNRLMILHYLKYIIDSIISKIFRVGS